MIIIRLRVEDSRRGDEADSVDLHTAALLLQEIAANRPTLFLSSFRERRIAPWHHAPSEAKK